MGLGEAITGYLQYFPNLKFRDFHEMESHSFKTLILILSEIGECQPQPRSQEFFPWERGCVSHPFTGIRLRLTYRYPTGRPSCRLKEGDGATGGEFKTENLEYR